MSKLIKKDDELVIVGKKWFDSIHGNTYFRCYIQLNNKILIKLPFQYGYGDHYIDAANNWLAENGYIDSPRHENGGRETLWNYCRNNNININYFSYEVKNKVMCKSDIF